MKALTVNIAPVQDFNGYDNPWPAGGGKNLFNKDTVTVGKWLNVSTGAIENTSTNYGISDWIPVKSGLPYVFTNPKSSRKWSYDSSKNPVEQITANSYTPSVDGYILLTLSIAAEDGVDLNTFQVEQGSALSAYFPYSNICPISGWSEVNVNCVGKNFFDDSIFEEIGWSLKEYEGVGTYWNGNAQRLFKNSRYAYTKGGILPEGEYGVVTLSFDFYCTSGSMQIYVKYSDTNTWSNMTGNITTSGHKSYTTNVNKVCTGIGF